MRTFQTSHNLSKSLKMCLMIACIMSMHIIYAVDYNLALNHEMNTCGYLHVNKPHSRKYIKGHIATNELTYIWRERNRNMRTYTLDNR